MLCSQHRERRGGGAVPCGAVRVGRVSRAVLSLGDGRRGERCRRAVRAQERPAAKQGAARGSVCVSGPGVEASGVGQPACVAATRCACVRVRRGGEDARRVLWHRRAA